MNILYILQQSIYNNEGKWISADSNVNMMSGMLREVLKNRPNWNFYILIGKLKDFADIKSYDEIFNDSRVHFIEYNFPVDAFLSRQHFNVFDFDKMYKKLPKIDVVWNNITELSRNIKTYLSYKKHDAKLITTCYWLDAPEIGEGKVDQSISYDWRQMDGFECSDLVVFTCESTKKAWIENAKKKFPINKYLKPILNKSVIWDFGFSQAELNEYGGTAFDKKTILFLNRLSGINYTHHEEFIEALKILKKIRAKDDWQVVFTNPSQKISWEYLKANVPNLYVYDEHTLTREKYIKLLWSGDISVHLYEKERYGGCSHREAVYTNNLIVSPKVFEYKRIQGNNYPFYCKVEPEKIAKALNKALDSDFTSLKNAVEIESRNIESSFEKIGTNVCNDIDAIMGIAYFM